MEFKRLNSHELSGICNRVLAVEKELDVVQSELGINPNQPLSHSRERESALLSNISLLLELKKALLGKNLGFNGSSLETNAPHFSSRQLAILEIEAGLLVWFLRMALSLRYLSSEKYICKLLFQSVRHYTFLCLHKFFRNPTCYQ